MIREFRIEYRSTPDGAWEPVDGEGWDGWENASRDEWKAECERCRQVAEDECARRSQDNDSEYRLVTRLCIDWMLA